jgi:hypothetical protein
LVSPAGAAEEEQASLQQAARVYFPPAEPRAAADAPLEAALPDAEPVGQALVVRQGLDSSQAGAEDGSVPRALDPSLVASPPVEPVAALGLDSVVRQPELPEQPQAADSPPEGCPEHCQDDWRADSPPELVGRAAPQPALDVPQWASPACSEAPASPLVEPPHWRPDAQFALHSGLVVVRDARPKPAAVWQKE